MKIAVPTRDWVTVSGHAGQAKRWLVYDLTDQGAAGRCRRPRASNWRMSSYSIISGKTARIPWTVSRSF